MDNIPPILFSFNSRRSKSNSLKIQYLNNRNYYINNTGYKISYKDESLYNYTKHRLFIIDSFKPDVPVKIYYDLTCLTEEKDNTISFELQSSGLLQDFIFLKHDTKEDT